MNMFKCVILRKMADITDVNPKKITNNNKTFLKE